MSIGFSKNGARDFPNSPPLERSACFLWQSLEVMNVSMMFETYDVLKNENLFQKTGVPFFSW